MTLYERIVKLRERITRKIFSAFMRTQFKAFGRASCIQKPLRLLGLDRIVIGEEVIISRMAWLQSIPIVEGLTPSIIIGDRTYVGNYAHIIAGGILEIGKDVLIADKVYISDNIHGYQARGIPAIRQPVEYKGLTSIGDGAWLGENVCVIGARVGKNSVIGANSVVTKDIPDDCVAAGAPAIIIRHYRAESQSWIRTDENGDLHV